MHNFADSEHLAELLGLYLHLGDGLSGDDLRQTYIFTDSQPVQEHKILKNEAKSMIAEFCQFFSFNAGNILSAQTDCTAVVRDKAGNTV